MFNKLYMSCPQKSDQEKLKQAPNYLTPIMDAMGIESRKKSASRDTSEFKAEMEVDTFFTDIDVSIQMKKESVKSNSVGCEQVVAMAKTNMDVVDKVKCTLNETKGNITTNVKAYNDVEIQGEDILLDCGKNGFRVDQVNKIKINNELGISASQMDKMVDDITKSVKETAEVLLSSDSGFGATEQGQKTIKNIVNQTNTSDYQAQIKKTIMEIASNVDAGNVLKLGSEKTKKVTIRGESCFISQSNVIEIMSKLIINDVMQQTFETFKKENEEYMDEIKSKSKSEGQPIYESLKSMFDSLNKKWLYVALAIGGLIIFIIIIYFIFTRIGSNSSNSGNDYDDNE
jgi:hypothetical protein